MLQSVFLTATMMLTLFVQTDGARVTLQSGNSVNGSVKIQPDGVELDGQTIAFSKLKSIVFEKVASQEITEAIRIELVDESILFAETLVIEGENLRLRSATFSNVKDDTAANLIKTRDINAILLKSILDAELQNQWNQISSISPEGGDALIIDRDGRLEPLEGIVGDVSEGKLNFKLDEREAKISLKKIQGIVFYHAAGRDMVDPICVLQLSDGSLLRCRELVPKQNMLRVTTVAGAQIAIASSSIRKIDFASGREAYLSDLEPSSSEWKALVASDTIFQQLKQLKRARINRSFRNGPLELDFLPTPETPYVTERMRFTNGFAIKAGSKLAFALGGRFQKLQGWIGFDPLASPSGNLLIRVRADGKTIWQKQMLNDGKAGPEKLDLELANAERLVIEVEYHDGREIGDTLHMCELKVIK